MLLLTLHLKACEASYSSNYFTSSLGFLKSLKVQLWEQVGSISNCAVIAILAVEIVNSQGHSCRRGCSIGVSPLVFQDKMASYVVSTALDVVDIESTLAKSHWEIKTRHIASIANITPERAHHIVTAAYFCVSKVRARAVPKTLYQRCKRAVRSSKNLRCSQDDSVNFFANPFTPTGHRFSSFSRYQK